MKKQRYIELPDTWDELTEADWREVLKIRHLVATTDHQWTPDDVRIETARMLLKNRGIKTQPNNTSYLLLLSQLQKSLTWLWQEQDGGLSLCYRSTANLLPRIRHGIGICHKEWRGPESHGADLMFGEFRQAIQHLKAWESEQNPAALCALAGLLYRPADSARRFCRRPYDYDSIDEKIARGRQMKPWQRWGIYAWFAYFCEYLTTGTFVLEGNEVTFAPLFDAASAPAGFAAGPSSLQQICLTLAESHVFGTARDVDNTPLLTVMQKLLMDHETLKKLKAKK